MSVSDSERDRTVKALTRHCGDGRLTLEELEERIELAYAAETSADLRALVRDLPNDLTGVTGVTPSPALQRHPSPPAAAPPHPFLTPAAKKGGDVALAVHAIVYVSVMALLVMIYMLTSPFGYPWPIWVAMPWGMALAIHAGVHKAVWRGRDV